MSFYERTWFIILMLIFIFPVGLYLMWKYKKFNKVVRIIITVICVIALIDNIFGESNAGNTSVKESTTAETEANESTTKKVDDSEKKNKENSEDDKLEQEQTEKEEQKRLEELEKDKAKAEKEEQKRLETIEKEKKDKEREQAEKKKADQEKRKKEKEEIALKENMFDEQLELQVQEYAKGLKLISEFFIFVGDNPQLMNTSEYRKSTDEMIAMLNRMLTSANNLEAPKSKQDVKKDYQDIITTTLHAVDLFVSGGKTYDMTQMEEGAMKMQEVNEKIESFVDKVN
ncbi:MULTISPECIES: O-antigen polymerase [unclassified Exiguobacterium]|uniref:O-antigen polymerase n=1 Tax=unclassified Exiguobacterium TaxID=2644629 RepID=UPI001357CFF1|nr:MULTISPECIES: O-antigen polymerase [unclassified Exiguobacterium]